MKKLVILFISLFFFTQALGQVFFGPENPISELSAAKPEHIETADLDSDGDLDVLIVGEGTQNLVWLENLDGKGSFGTPTEIATGLHQPSNVIAIDIDGDGDMDVVQAVWQDYELFWLENLDGQGNFGDKMMIDDYANGIWRVRGADVDGDGDQDLLSAEREGGAIVWYQNMDGQGNFSDKKYIKDDMSNARDAYPVDFDNDGDFDVVTVDWSTQIAGWHENLDGLGNFSDRKLIFDAIDDINIVFCRDFDKDGYQDVLVRDRTDIFWIRNMDGGNTFSAPNNISQGETIVDYYPSDFDGDGDEDLLVINTYFGHLGWFSNNGQGTFAPLQIIPNNIGGCDIIHSADLDGDNDQDFIGIAWLRSWVYWHENTDGNGNTQIPRFISKSDLAGPNDMIVEDLTGNMKKELALASRYEHKLFTYEKKDREGAYSDIMTLPGFVLEPQSISSGDIDGDGNKDLLSASLNNGSLYWSKNNGNGQFGSPNLVGQLSSTATDVIAEDMDRDGDLDVIGTSLYGDMLAIFVNDGNGNFPSMVMVSDLLDGAFDVLAADLDNDSDPDLAVASRYGDKISWFENQGNLSFSAEKIIDEDMNGTRCLAAGDFDNDGDTDLAATAWDILKWYKNTYGRSGFEAIEIETDEYLQNVNDIGVIDIDGDGDLDIFTASEDLDHINWVMNDGSGSFSPQIPIGNGLNEPKAIGFDDVDGDGKMDVIVASHADNKIGWYQNVDYPVFTGHPLEKTICQSGEVKFSADADKADSYRWQISEPYNDWFGELENDQVYSGVNTTELSINVDGTYLNMARYRLVVTYLGVDFYSEPAMLNVDRLEEAYAGDDIEICTDWTYLYANTPNDGVGEWSVLNGYAEFDDINNAYPTVSSIQHGTNVLLWTITNGSCVSEDEVEITKYDSVTVTIPVDTVVVNDGENAVFTVEASGDVISYQWYREGSILTEEPGGVEGTQTATLTLYNVLDDVHPGNYHCVVEGKCNWAYGDHIYLDVLSVNTQEVFKQKITLYPNPVKDKLTLESIAPIQAFEILNSEGKRVIFKKGLLNKTIEISVGALPSGSYIIKVQLEKGSRQLIFVK